MNFIEAIVIKYALVFAVVFLIFGLSYGTYISIIYWLSAIITIIALLSDIIALPRLGNAKASALDFVLFFATTWLSFYLVIGNPNFSLVIASLLVAALLAISEWFYHIYLSKRILGNKETSHTLKGPPTQH